MAHIKASATTKGNRDSVAKRLGIKIFAGEKVVPGNILVRQRGTKFYPGMGVRKGGDDTLFAVKSGTASFSTRHDNKYVSIV